jgi:predicted RNA-binding Zn ribbon-like protein
MKEGVLMVSAATDSAARSQMFDLDTGELALDFANTLDGRYDPQPREPLREYQDLLAFSVQSGTLDQQDVERLAAAAAQSPKLAAQQLSEAVALREAIVVVFSAVAAGRKPDTAELDTLNAFHQRAMSHGKVVATGEEFGWCWEDDVALDRPLWPIAKAAVDLLLTGDRRRLRECAADDCGWLFYDTSRNQSRRWCSMQSCGNRAKVHQFRERKRGDAGRVTGR